MKTLIILCAPCGVGKSTMKGLLAERKNLPDFVCLDTDEIGVGWYNYSGTEKEIRESFSALLITQIKRWKKLPE